MRRTQQSVVDRDALSMRRRIGPEAAWQTCTAAQLPVPPKDNSVQLARTANQSIEVVALQELSNTHNKWQYMFSMRSGTAAPGAVSTFA